MADKIVLRAATPADAAAIADMIRLSFARQSVPIDPPPSARLETEASVAAHFAAGGGGAVAWAIVAAVLWEEKEDALYGKRLSVHPDWRRRGLATRLIEAAERAARARGLSRLTLSTRLVLADNRRLFASCGFRETALHAHPGYGAPTYVDLEKRLGEKLLNGVMC
jgi:GNAT superfamily N-acetyltransferase